MNRRVAEILARHDERLVSPTPRTRQADRLGIHRAPREVRVAHARASSRCCSSRSCTSAANTDKNSFTTPASSRHDGVIARRHVRRRQVERHDVGGLFVDHERLLVRDAKPRRARMNDDAGVRELGLQAPPACASSNFAWSMMSSTSTPRLRGRRERVDDVLHRQVKHHHSNRRLRAVDRVDDGLKTERRRRLEIRSRGRVVTERLARARLGRALARARATRVPAITSVVLTRVAGALARAARISVGHRRSRRTRASRPRQRRKRRTPSNPRRAAEERPRRGGCAFCRTATATSTPHTPYVGYRRFTYANMDLRRSRLRIARPPKPCAPRHSTRAATSSHAIFSASFRGPDAGDSSTRPERIVQWPAARSASMLVGTFGGVVRA